MGALVKAGRVSRTVIKPQPGFRAELPGLDLATLIQMTCARRERLVVRVSSYGEEGYLFSAEGRLVHATVGTLVGDEAVLRMLAWPTGDFSICERPFPLRPTIETSTEGLLLRAAQRIDEAALDRETDSVLNHEIGLAEQLEGEEEVGQEAGLAEDEPTSLQPAFHPYAPLPALNLPATPWDLTPEIDVELASSVPPPPPLSSWPLAAPVATRPVESSPPAGPALASLLQARAPDDELPTTPTPPPRRVEARDAIPPQRPSRPPPPPARTTSQPRIAQPRMEVTPVRASRPPPPDALPPVSLGRISEPPPRRVSQPPPGPAVSLPRPVAHGDAARRLPPVPPASARKLVAEESAVLASVRIDARGEVVSASGGDDQLPQLVAYVNRIASLVQADFALDPFDALHAELSGKRVIVYREDGALVGVVMKPSSAAQELRQRLGV